ncbi:formate/nitrite transporter family protein [Pricia sp. S334]|uniref:Formate/nitrite transporter family protein n=1 Tax=Pricia mediterranea TaxID=3076079 RepID=A0ABU3L289_9FLAO|nr:formate/nitrite transporter family protein [Pricia sp. S334]MDT7827378.1 formate/nitrite transporter family protein [Pricia sp. S334]
MKEEEKDQKEHQKQLEEKSDNIKGGKKYSDILSRVIHEGEQMFAIKSKAIFLSGVIAGLEIGFSYFMICTFYALLDGHVEQNILFKSFGFVYPIGFILVILGKSALYTEQTSLLALPVLNGQRSLLEMLRLWGLVISGNVLGGIVFTFFIGILAPNFGLFTSDTMVTVGHHVLDYEAWVLFLSAITAGWLMGLLTWLLNSTETTLTRIVIIFMITGVIGFGGFHHSIVGNIEAFGAFWKSASVSGWDYLKFLLLALIGNGVGGAIVVGLFKYRIFESNYADES